MSKQLIAKFLGVPETTPECFFRTVSALQAEIDCLHAERNLIQRKIANQTEQLFILIDEAKIKNGGRP